MQNRARQSLGLMVVTHTRAYLEDCLRSVQDQTQAPSMVVVIDNGSPVEEGVVEAVQASGFYAVRTDMPLPVSSARNIGCELLRSCDFIVNLDGDDVLFPQFVETYWQAAIDYDADIVYGPAEFIGDESGIFDWVTDRPISDLRYGNFIPMNALFATQLWQRTGGFDPQITIRIDWDFWLSCAELGARTYFVDEPLWKYRKHAASLSTNELSSNQRLLSENIRAIRTKHHRFIHQHHGWRKVARNVDRTLGHPLKRARRRLRTAK